ncbi:hypothetical protein HK102_000302 [Quaeritorhiza haematococci]|nr:hypothetical protein HK102_000302 [Quaeritorhiza haematococci]
MLQSGYPENGASTPPSLASLSLSDAAVPGDLLFSLPDTTCHNMDGSTTQGDLNIVQISQPEQLVFISIVPPGAPTSYPTIANDKGKHAYGAGVGKEVSFPLLPTTLSEKVGPKSFVFTEMGAERMIYRVDLSGSLSDNSEEIAMFEDLIAFARTSQSSSSTVAASIAPAPSSATVSSIASTATVASTSTVLSDEKRPVPPAPASAADHQKLVLMGPTGKVLGVVADDVNYMEDGKLSGSVGASNSTAPVVVDMTSGVQYGADGKPQQQVSMWDKAGTYVTSGADLLARGITVGASMLGSTIKDQGEKVKNRTIPNSSPTVVKESTMKRLDTMNAYSTKAVQISGATVRAVVTIAGKVGSKINKSVAGDKNENRNSPAWKFVQTTARSLEKVGESWDQATRDVTREAANATVQYVEHKYGAEAGLAAAKTVGVVKNCTLVYIDARGISRKAILYTIGKKAIKYKLEDGTEVMVEPQKDGSVTVEDVASWEKKEREGRNGNGNGNGNGSQTSTTQAEGEQLPAYTPSSNGTGTVVYGPSSSSSSGQQPVTVYGPGANSSPGYNVYNKGPYAAPPP